MSELLHGRPTSAPLCRPTALTASVAWRKVTPFLLAAGIAMARPTTAHAYRLAGSAAEFGGQDRVVDADGRIVIRVRSRTPTGVSVSELDRAVRSAAAAWNEVPCSRLEVVYEGITEAPPVDDDGVTTIDTVDAGWLAMGNSRDAPAATVSRYTNLRGQWEIADADVFLNNETVSWTLVGIDPTTVILHEIGHLLGLSHPCGDEGLVPCDPTAPPLMSPIYDDVFEAPGADDVAGVCFLYPTHACSETSCNPNELCVDGRCLSACDGVVCAADEVCDLGRCVRDCSSGRCEVPCAADAECAAGSRCRDAICAPATGTLGDPCASVHDCAAGLCPEGYCTEVCTTICADGYACDNASMVCEATLGVFGAACTNGAECASGRCYQSSGGAALCTRLCGPAEPACPAGFECADVDGRMVCRPPPQLGCEVGAASRAPPWLALLACLGLVFRRRSQK